MCVFGSFAPGQPGLNPSGLAIPRGILLQVPRAILLEVVLRTKMVGDQPSTLSDLVRYFLHARTSLPTPSACRPWHPCRHGISQTALPSLPLQAHIILPICFFKGYRRGAPSSWSSVRREGAVDFLGTCQTTATCQIVVSTQALQWFHYCVIGRSAD